VIYHLILVHLERSSTQATLLIKDLSEDEGRTPFFLRFLNTCSRSRRRRSTPLRCPQSRARPSERSSCGLLEVFHAIRGRERKVRGFASLQQIERYSSQLKPYAGAGKIRSGFSMRVLHAGLMAVLISASGSAATQTIEGLSRDDFVARWLAETGFSVLRNESPDVKAAAEYAVSTQSAVTGEELKLLSIKHGRMQSNSRMRELDDIRTGARVRSPHPYELWLHVLKDAKQQSVLANVSQNTDGSYKLLRWSWLGDANPGGQAQARSNAQAAAGAGESALTCEGKAPGPLGRPMLFKIELLQVNRAEVTLVDESRARECKCAYVLGGLSDQSKGVVPCQTVNLHKQRCDSNCEADVAKHLNDDIRVTRWLSRNQRDATPFAGSQIATCDLFSMDLERLLPMELQRIDALNVPDRVRQMLKDKKLDDSSDR